MPREENFHFNKFINSLLLYIINSLYAKSDHHFQEMYEVGLTLRVFKNLFQFSIYSVFLDVNLDVHNFLFFYVTTGDSCN